MMPKLTFYIEAKLKPMVPDNVPLLDASQVQFITYADHPAHHPPL